MKRFFAFGGAASSAALGLASCGSGPVPEQFIGRWGADCARPYMEFTRAGTMRVLAVNVEYKIKSATLAGNVLSVIYDNPDAGTVTETYAVENGALRQLKTVSDKGGEATWNVSAMAKCG